MRRHPGNRRARAAAWRVGLAVLGAAIGPGAAGAPAARAQAPEAPYLLDDDRQAERLAMVERDLADTITDPRVLDAMRAVPRHRFVPDRWQGSAYRDRPLPIGHGQTISQPWIVARMTELLALTPKSRVLEIGTGSGYQAAVLAELGADVWSIEIVEPLGREAAARLAALGYGDIHLRVGDGYLGWPEAAPFDAIIVTCAPEAVPRPLEAQLAEGGRMVIPVGERGDQELVLIEKRDGALVTTSIVPVRFVPMVDEAGRTYGRDEGGE